MKRESMNYGAIRNADGSIDVGLWDWHHRKFLADMRKEYEHDGAVVLYAIPFAIHGKSYTERKDSLRELAIDFQSADGDVSGGLSWGEFADVCAFFERNGRKLGLLREFRENAIC